MSSESDQPAGRQRRAPRTSVPALAALLTSALALLAAADAGAARSAASSPAVVKAARLSVLGTILVTAGGRTVYHDQAEGGTPRCNGGCLSTWLPLLLAPGARLEAGSGATAALLGTVVRPGGKRQVTYGGKLLYLYVGDAKPGEANGQGVGRIWYVLAPSGVVVTKALSAPGAATSGGSKSGSAAGAGSGSAGSGAGSSSSAGSAGTGTGSGTMGSAGGNGTASSDAAFCAADPMACNNGVPIPGG